MKIKMSRRLTAVVAAAGLALVSVPASIPAAQADDRACGLGETCAGALTGALGDSAYQIVMPPKFNGTVLLYSHGYRIAQPVPAAIGVALGLDKAPTYSATSVPGVGAAYVGNGIAQVAPSAEVAASLLGQGYALAGTGYANQGWAVAEGVEAGENLIKYINGGGIKGAKQILAWGDSMGSVVTQALVQRNPGKIAGTNPRCGALAGPDAAFETAMTVVYTWKTLIDPTIKGANYAPGAAGYAQAVGDLAKIFGTINAVATGQATVSQAGFPIALANLLSGLMAGLPTVSSTYDGVTVNPAVATLGLAGASAGGYSPLSSGQSAAAAMLQNVAAAAALGVMGRYEMEQRVRTIGGLAPTDNANFTSNVGVNYSELLSPEQRGEYGDTFATAGPGVLDGMLAALAAGQRFAANPVAVKIVNSLPGADPVYGKPAVLLTDTFDPITPAGNAGEFFEGVVTSKEGKSAAKKGMLKAVSYYAVPPADGWTRFTEGAKSPSAALSAAALGGSGVGHCAFTTDQSVGSIAALMALVKADTAKKVAAAKRVGYRPTGINKDRFYEPPALKNPAATVN
jgi:hypothetical protein